MNLDGYKLSPRLKSLLRKIGLAGDEFGVDVYLVGGLPRDILLGQPNLDVDIVVEGDAIAFANYFSRREGGRAKPHKQFQTAIVALPKGFRIDVAAARTERYERPGALPVVEISGIRNDLYRRDFTVNSIAVQLNPKNYGKVVDCFGGRQDLTAKIVRVLHSLSFVDDPMRTIRAVRFEQRYCFALEKETERLLREAVGARLLDQVSGERIGKEITLILKEEKPLPAVRRLGELGILAAIHPKLRLHQRTELLFARLEKIFSSDNVPSHISRWAVYLLALLCHLSPEVRNRVAQRLVLPKRVRDWISELEGLKERLDLLESPDLRPSQVYFALRDLPVEVLLLAAAMSKLADKKIFLYLGKLRATSTQISGEELKEMGISPGPVFQKILDGILASRLDGEVGSRREELALAKFIWRQEGK